MLEKYYGECIALMVLVSIHPEDPFFTAVPDLNLEVTYIMAERRRVHSAVLRAEETASVEMLCPHSRQLMTEACRVQGSSYQKGCAAHLWCDGGAGELCVDDEKREAVRCLVEVQAASDLGRQGLQAMLSSRDDMISGRQRWEDLMPECGLDICAGFLRSSGVEFAESKACQ